jgi:hypothetical protein
MDPAIDIVRRHVSSQITELQDIKERKYRDASGSAEPAEFSSLQNVDAEQNKPGQDEDKEQGDVDAQNCQVVGIDINFSRRNTPNRRTMFCRIQICAAQRKSRTSSAGKRSTIRMITTAARTRNRSQTKQSGV